MLILGAFGTLSSRRADGISDDAKRKYVEGVRFVGDGECELAVKKLRDAILSDGKEGARKFRGTGVNYEDYFPHYYLGTCLEKLGQNGEALRELQESDRQGAVKRRADLNRSLSASLQRLASAVPPPTPVVIAQLKPTAVPTAPSPAPTSAPPPPQRTAPPRPTPVPTVPPPVVLKLPIPVLPAPAPTRPPPTKPPAPLPTSAPTADPTPIRPQPLPPTAVPPKERATPIPDAILTELRSGIRSYFKGDFDDAITRLEACEARSNTARFFLAYSLAGKYLLMGRENNPDLLKRARTVYQKARSGGARLQGESLISSAVTTILEKS